MGRAGTIARRTFMVGSVAVMSGVAFGYYMYRKPGPNPLLDDLKEGEAALTPYVLINASGITLITPRADSGQGAYSVQAMMIAEELDVDMDQVSVSPGVPSPAYYNTALAAESAPFRPTDRSTMANTTRGVMDAVMKFMGMQLTGGSTTVPDGYEKLRMAGAVARETLKLAAGKRTGQDPKKMTTERAHVILPDGTRIAYTDLAVEAAQIEPADHLALRHHSKWRIMGTPQQRLDIVAKSTGTLRYGIDFEPEGVVHATVRTNPRKGGGMNGYDAEAAKQMRGVKQVLPVTGGVAVVADNTWRAFAAAEAIDIDWGTAPYPAEMDAHWQALADSFNDDHLDSRKRDDGDVDEAFEGTTELVEAEYRAPYLAHAPLEPSNATVLVGDDRVDVWSGTQVPRFVQANLAKLTGINVDNIHVHVQMMGGSFGHGAGPWCGQGRQGARAGPGHCDALGDVQPDGPSGMVRAGTGLADRGGGVGATAEHPQLPRVGLPRAGTGTDQLLAVGRGVDQRVFPRCISGRADPRRRGRPDGGTAAPDVAQTVASGAGGRGRDVGLDDKARRGARARCGVLHVLRRARGRGDRRDRHAGRHPHRQRLGRRRSRAGD